MAPKPHFVVCSEYAGGERLARPEAWRKLTKPKVVITLPAYRAAGTLEKTVVDIPPGWRMS